MLLDAFALVAHLIDEPAAVEVAAMLHDRDDPPVVNVVNLAETIDRSSRVGGLELVDVVQRITWLRDGGLEVLAVDAFDGAVAGALRAQFYDRDTRPLSLADCCALACAVRYGQAVATADPDLAWAAREMDLVVAPLPDSRGRRP